MEAPSIAVLPIQPAILAAGLAAGRTPAVLRGVASAGQVVPATQTRSGPGLREQLDRASFQERPDVLLAHVETRLVQLLGLDAGISIPPEMPFLQLGLDSLMSLEIKNGIETVLEVSLPHTIFFEYPNLLALRQYFSLVAQAGVSAAPIANRGGDHDEIRF